MNHWINGSGQIKSLRQMSIDEIALYEGCTHKVGRFKDGQLEEMGWIIPNYENSMEGFHAYLPTYPDAALVVGFIRKNDTVVWCPQDAALAVVIFGKSV